MQGSEKSAVVCFGRCFYPFAEEELLDRVRLGCKLVPGPWNTTLLLDGFRIPPSLHPRQKRDAAELVRSELIELAQLA